jgi:hypothetical protein
MENLLLLFTPELPCWNYETVSVAGENPEGLEALAETGDLIRIGEGYVLTEQGTVTRERIAAEMYIPVAPISKLITDSEKANELLGLNIMTQYLDKAFVTDWGIKEITVREVFPVMPCLNDDEYFAFRDGKVIALWPNHPLVMDFMEAFPNWGVSARKLATPSQEGLDAWALAKGLNYGTLTVDFMLRSRADFNHYKNYPQLPSDRFRFLDADRLFVHKVKGEPANLLPFIGKLHIFMTEQRRIYLPGWFDIDHDQNEDWNLLAFVTDTEIQLDSLTKTLRAWGHDLINPVNPLFILGTSIERLRAQAEQKRTIYDWFQEETIRIMRPDAPDGE